MESTGWDAYAFEIGAFSSEEGAKLAAEQSAASPLRWEKSEDGTSWRGFDPSDEEGPFFFFKRMRLQ